MLQRSFSGHCHRYDPVRVERLSATVTIRCPSAVSGPPSGRFRSPAGYRMGVSLVAAAVCPHPPLVVPEIAGSAAPELDDLRAACDAAVDRLWRSGARHLLIVGADRSTREYHPPFVGSFAPWGASVPATLGVEPDDGRQTAVGSADSGQRGDAPSLPLSLLVAVTALEARGQVPYPDAIADQAGLTEDQLAAPLHDLAEKNLLHREDSPLEGLDFGPRWCAVQPA